MLRPPTSRGTVAVEQQIQDTEAENLRGEGQLFIGARSRLLNSSKCEGRMNPSSPGPNSPRASLGDMGLQGSVTPLRAKKKWDNLKKRYKDCKYPGSGEGV
ncbi:hypothetical protein CesoFtcFv8_000064, partial [Champsocephalus esox]